MKPLIQETPLGSRRVVLVGFFGVVAFIFFGTPLGMIMLYLFLVSVVILSCLAVLVALLVVLAALLVGVASSPEDKDTTTTEGGV